MKNHRFLLLFCCIALLHFVSQLCLLRAAIYLSQSHEPNFDTHADLRAQFYGRIFEVVSFPSSYALEAFTPPSSPEIGRIQAWACMSATSLLWAGVFTMAVRMISRVFSRRSLQSA